MREYTTSSPLFSKKINIVETSDPAHADNINAATKQLLENTLKLREENEIFKRIANGIYTGRDLTQVFAAEIAEFEDEWDWIRYKIQWSIDFDENPNTSGTHFDPNLCDISGVQVADYIPIVVDGNTFNMHVAGIFHSGFSRYVSFISNKLFPEDIVWNANGSNNAHIASDLGIENTNPFINSDLNKWLKDVLYNKLPEKLKRVIWPHSMNEGSRYAVSGQDDMIDDFLYTLSSSRLWVPSEYEVFGSTISGTKKWSVGSRPRQFPIFFRYPRFFYKSSTDNKHYNWWLRTPESGNSTKICAIDNYGNIAQLDASSKARVPICFDVSS